MSEEEIILDSILNKLSQQVGKLNRYENLLRQLVETNPSPTFAQKIKIAEEVLNGPWLGVLGAMAEEKIHNS